MGLAPVVDRYDLVLVDCPPSLGILTINGLTAADAVVIPLQCETLSHRGVGQLLETVADVRAYTKPRPRGARRGRDDVRRAQPAPARDRGRRRRAVRHSPCSSRRAAQHPLRGGAGDRPLDPRPRADLHGARAYRELAAHREVLAA